MTAEEIKDALLKKYPVIAGGIEYKCVTAVIYREQDERIVVSAELLDRSGNSVTVVSLKNVEKGDRNERREKNRISLHRVR